LEPGSAEAGSEEVALTKLLPLCTDSSCKVAEFEQLVVAAAAVEESI
jgi:hypothetical protein